MIKRLLAVAAAVALAACSGAKQKPHEEKIPVTVAVAEVRDIPVEIRAIGTVQPISTVGIRALAGGQLQKIWFREGDDVHRGQMLFTIDPRPYQAAMAQAQANLARDQANLKNAESQAARYADLVKKDFVTREEYDKFMAAAEAARATAAADRAAVDNARLQLSYCEIRSPIDGRTGSLMVHAGNIVRANDTTTPLVVINQVTPVYVQFSVPESQLADLRARGLQSVPVNVSPQAGGTSLAEGRLTFVDNAVDTSTGTITLKATFANANRALWPGQFVNVSVTLSKRANATVVPSEAIQTGQRGQYLYVVKGEAVEMRPVKIVSADEQLTVIASGVQPGETVVTDGQLRLTPKSKVEVKKKV